MAHLLLTRKRILACRNAMSPQAAGVFWFAAPASVRQVRLRSMLRRGCYGVGALQGFQGGRYSLAEAGCEESRIGFWRQALGKVVHPPACRRSRSWRYKVSPRLATVSHVNRLAAQLAAFLPISSAY